MMKSFLLQAALLLCTAGFAAETFISPDRGLLLNEGGRITIFVCQDEPGGVTIAAGNLADDLEKVCGAVVSFVSGPEDARIIVGTTGSRELDRLARKGAFKKEELEGKREKFILTTFRDKLIIAGSDKRGAIYGIYELSRQAGVSPWYWWADVPPTRHDSLYVLPGTYTDGEPAVQWRGIFLNDEAPCLTGWVANTFGTNYGGKEFYAKVFELVLRLRGNLVWPAMWGWAFYADDSGNGRLADEMGVIIGTSHHEPMARNHQEWARHRDSLGVWNYASNRAVLDRFFFEGIERVKDTEDLITIGMRGDGDEAMSEDTDIRLLEQIVERQRAIIEEVTGRPAEERPQVWALYKEVLDYYDKGMRVPDDVTILLCDDNWGDVRRVPKETDRDRPGGWGLYYHVDYVGAPRNTKWINVTQTSAMWEQLRLAWDFGLQKMWILNVGDLKPMEYQIQFFLDMAWKPMEFSDILPHTEAFMEPVTGPDLAPEAARILDLCTKYSSRVTSEMLDAETYSLSEWKNVCNEWLKLETEALRLYADLPEESRDAFFELVLFPVQAMGNVHEMYRSLAENRKYFESGNPEANLWAERTEKAFARDKELTDRYNNNVAKGKWNGMMKQKHISYTSWNDDFPEDVCPEVRRIAEEPSVFSGGESGAVMEAAHWWRSVAGEGREWTVWPGLGRFRDGVALTPYTSSPGGDYLEYRFSLPAAGDSLHVYVAVKPTLDFLDTGGRYELSLDDGLAAVVPFNERMNEKPDNIYSIFYPTVASRAIISYAVLPAADTEIHTLRIRPLSPGIVFEKIVVSAGTPPEGRLLGEESPRAHEYTETDRSRLASSGKCVAVDVAD